VQKKKEMKKALFVPRDFWNILREIRRVFEGIETPLLALHHLKDNFIKSIFLG